VTRNLAGSAVIGGTSAVLIRKDALRGLRFNTHYAQMFDWDMWLRTAARHDIGYIARTGGAAVRDRTSYYLASIVVGTPIWLSLWLLAQRRLGRSPLERQARERRWYLAAIFAVTSVVALFGLRFLLQDVLILPGADNVTLTVRDGIFAGARLLVWGAVWLAFAPPAATGPEPPKPAPVAPGGKS